MAWLSYEALDQQRDRFDAQVRGTPQIDHYCSAHLWQRSAQEAFYPEKPPFIYQEEDGATVALMAYTNRLDRLLLVPLEPIWGLASPLIGAPERVSALLNHALDASPLRPDALYLSGLPHSPEWIEPLARHLSPRWRLQLRNPLGRRSASLEGGVDAFLGRRSAKFRAELRRAQRKAAQAGLTFERLGAAELRGDLAQHFEGWMRVEAQSWKGRQGYGAHEGPARLFYTRMAERLAAQGALRAVVARQGERAIGYIFGGLFGADYRGLQVSFDDQWRSYGVGNLLQMQMVEGLCAEGLRSYQLGTAMPYKRHWAEQLHTTLTVLAHRRG